ncbi:MAG: hypothetical protein ACREMD_01450 [Gemmatimonadota bacterium]
MSALRLATVTLTTPEPRESARFYRWCLDLEPDADSAEGDGMALSWGHEDRVLLVPPGTGSANGETFALRMPARPMAEIVAWCREVGLAPERAMVPTPEAEAARAAWPDREVVSALDEASGNRVRLRVRSPGGLVVELEFPLPKEVLAPRGRIGPFRWRSRDWSGLEIPGLLGVRTGVPDPADLRSFARKLGVEPMEGPDDPLSVGDHQWIVEPRETPGIYGFAVVVSAARIGALQRTLDHVGVEYRLDGNRLLAADPGGRVVLIQGVRGA